MIGLVHDATKTMQCTIFGSTCIHTWEDACSMLPYIWCIPFTRNDRIISLHRNPFACGFLRSHIHVQAWTNKGHIVLEFFGVLLGCLHSLRLGYAFEVRVGFARLLKREDDVFRDTSTNIFLSALRANSSSTSALRAFRRARSADVLPAGRSAGMAS